MILITNEKIIDKFIQTFKDLIETLKKNEDITREDLIEVHEGAVSDLESFKKSEVMLKKINTEYFT